MKTIYKKLPVIFLMLVALSLRAQDLDVSGVVRDGANGEVIPGATVLIKGTTNGTITDIEGRYNLSGLSADDVVTVSFIGFKTFETTVGDQSTIDIDLAMNISELDEVVVIGYGTQRKKVLTAAIESVSAEEITATPVVRIDQALQGRAPGVQVVNQSGQPGERPGIKIRGIGTDRNSEPLYLVDGAPVDNIDFLNPGDIESMEVLKDAASAAIYGAKGANGVVLITTKSGKEGRFTVNYSGYYGVQNAANKVDMLNAEEYIQLMADGGVVNLQGRPFERNMVPENNVDWQDELFSENVPIENHSLQFSGGNEKSTFSSSISYFSQQGIVGAEKSRFERYSARLSTRTKVNEWVSWGNSFNYGRMKTRGVNSNQLFTNELGSALSIDPLTSVYEHDQTVLNNTYPYNTEPIVYNENGRAFAFSNNIAGEVVNPLAKLQTRNQQVIRNQILGSFFVELEPLKGLKLKSQFSGNMTFQGIEDYTDRYYLTGDQQRENTFVSDEFQQTRILQLENTISYDFTRGKHHFNFVVGQSGRDDDWKRLYGAADSLDVSNPNLRYIDRQLLIDQQRAGGSSSEIRRASYFGRMLYDYNDRVSFSATFRRDGSSKFGSNNRWGDFMSFGTSWVINEEPFFPDIQALSFLKLRASWGQNGNDEIGDFQFLSLLGYNANYNFAGAVSEGAIPDKLENADIKWESSEQLNFGVESAFFSNQLKADFDYYVKTTNDLLQIGPIPAQLGQEPSFSNVGQMRNEGYEIALNWNSSAGGLEYSLGVNGAYNKNTMERVATDQKVIQGASWISGQEITRIIEGERVTSFIGYKTDGIFQSQDEIFSYINQDGIPVQEGAQPGDFRYVDVNGDGTINEDDKTVIGSPVPDWTFGANFSVSYKNFDVSVFASGQYGNEIFKAFGRPDVDQSNKQVSVLDHWTPENPSNIQPRFVAGDPSGNYSRPTDQLNIEDGSFIRIRNIQLGYNLPDGILKKLRCQAWRTYISVENLHTFTRYTGLDPEVGAPVNWGGTNAPSILDMGIDRGIYPQARTFRIGTSITF